MKTDTIFYQLFQEFPWIFFQLIERPQTNLDAYKFIAPEIKQRSFRLDGLFITKEEFTEQPLYFVEVQFYKEQDFYDRIFPSIFLYFSQYKPLNPDWFIIVIFDRQGNDVTIPQRYQEIAKKRLQRIYLDQISKNNSSAIGLDILRLVVESENQAGTLARNLITRTTDELDDNLKQQQLIELIETIIIYKFPQLSYQEIEKMLNLEEIKKTRVYQDAKEEGIQQGKLEQKISMISSLQKVGLTIEKIAEILELEENIVRKNIK